TIRSPKSDGSFHKSPPTAGGRVRVGGSSIRLLLPALMILAALGLWEFVVRFLSIPTYLLPAPSLVATRLFAHFGSLTADGLITLSEALLGFALSCALSLLAAAAMVHSRTLERTLLPLAILLKVTPVVAVAP